MNTFVVRYLEEVFDPTTGRLHHKQLGQACYDGIEELLLPHKARYGHLYLAAQFQGNATRRWRVDSVSVIPNSAATPTACDIVLKANNGPGETYLSTTLSQGSRISSLLQFGTMVEVDYGFIPAIAKHNNGSLFDSANTDALLSGEMHKRRLALVVKASKGTVQVVPVTSNAPDLGDKACFEIAPGSLKNLARYSTSGLRSWALCGMVDSVSPCRVLPPETISPKGGIGRLTTYPERLPRQERIFMLSSLAHFIGVTNYDELRTAAEELKEIKKREKRKSSQALAPVESPQEAAHRTALQEVALDLARHSKQDLEQLVRDRMQLNAELAAELAAAQQA